jgi:hypothetical protein
VEQQNVHFEEQKSSATNKNFKNERENAVNANDQTDY